MDLQFNFRALQINTLVFHDHVMHIAPNTAQTDNLYCKSVNAFAKKLNMHHIYNNDSFVTFVCNLIQFRTLPDKTMPMLIK